ncbi:hypothetical protein FUA23_16390 [Neolewinella aurantiaca]|uniref:Uncharacterized protein n=1 Tax=Neolewinella aurantiaca TaxID=2602767 RepID=A0A5C7FB59_9BACT|nr:DUF6428 family protein [Neolewinella aurantiaca]TXF88059.1 hypothetical protein FUA23_16390 [Neolewinella aurantiaca]
MRLTEIKSFLAPLDTLLINLPDGTRVPAHFHVTEVGKVTKNFIDCGGTLRDESVANFQLWSANDYDHRLHPGKLISIIELAENKLGLGDLEIEVEYQGEDSIVKYDLEARDGELHLVGKATACLAMDACGIPEKKSVDLSNLVATGGGCTPGGGCC